MNLRRQFDLGKRLTPPLQQRLVQPWLARAQVVLTGHEHEAGIAVSGGQRSLQADQCEQQAAPQMQSLRSEYTQRTGEKSEPVQALPASRCVPRSLNPQPWKKRQEIPDRSVLSAAGQGVVA